MTVRRVARTRDEVVEDYFEAQTARRKAIKEGVSHVHDVPEEVDVDSDERQEGESDKDAGDRIIAKYKAQATSPTKAIRAMCVYCMNGQPREVAKCTAPECPLFAFRMGFNPYHGRAKNPISK